MKRIFFKGQCLFLFIYLGLASNVSTAQIITTVVGSGTPGHSGDGGPATNALMNYPQGIATDASGNLFVADQFNCCIRKINSSGVISTVAGNGIPGYAGNGGPATAANLNHPRAVALDASGNMFIADSRNNVIRKVTAAGVISTIAGDTTTGSGGDGGPATAAQLNAPSGLAVDASGNIFIADRFNSRIRKVNSSGVISTIAGTTAGFSGDGGAATAAQLNTPSNVVIDGSGAIIVSDFSNNRIRRINSSGVINTIAGTGSSGSSGDGGPATAATLTRAEAIAIDAIGNIYFTADFRVRKIDTFGTITKISGTSYGYSGDGGPATAASSSTLLGIAADGSGNIYTSDFENGRVQKISASGTITFFAGSSLPGYGGDGGAATSASILHPRCAVMDGSGNMYVSDYDNNRIRKVSASGVITTYAGTGTASFSGDGGPATAATIAQPTGLALDGSGNLYFSDLGNARIRKITPSGTISSIVSASCTDIAIDGSGNLFYAEFTNNRIRKRTPSGTITQVAGNGSAGYSGDGGPATNAKLNDPEGIALDAAGNLYIADNSNSRIRKVNTSGIISTIAGSGSAGYSGDGGAATNAQLYSPLDVISDAGGNVYFVEATNQCIREVDASGTISTLSGNGFSGFFGDGGSASAGILYAPWNLTTDGSSIYVADMMNNRIRKINFCSPVVAPIFGAVTLCVGATDTLTDTTSSGVWSSSSSSVASVSTSGVVTGIAGGVAVISYSVTNSCGTSFATHSVTVISTPSAGSIAGATGLCAGATITLTSSGGSSGGTWSSSSTSVATISSSGVVTGTTTGSTLISYAVTNSCGTAMATYTVTVNPIPNAGAISGGSSVCDGGGMMTLSESVSGGAWSSGTPSVATINASGIVTGVTAGTVVISYSVTNSCGTATATHTTTVNSVPVAGTISGTTSLCAGSSVILTSSGGSSGGTWSLGSTTTATVSASGVLMGLLAGVATVSYTVSNGCGTVVSTTTVTILGLPSAAFITGTDSLCPGLSTTLSDTAAGGIWVSSNSSIATVSSSGVISASAMGTTSILYIVSNSCGSDTATFSFVVNGPGACPDEVGWLQHSAPVLTLYPNPNEGTFFLGFSETANEEISVTITNVLGEKVKGLVVGSNQSAIIKLDLVPGLYLATVYSNQGIFTKRFMVE